MCFCAATQGNLLENLRRYCSDSKQACVATKWGDALRWKELDVDIHISSFYEEVEIKKENEVAALFEKFPQLNVSEVARSLGIHSRIDGSNSLLN